MTKEQRDRLLSGGGLLVECILRLDAPEEPDASAAASQASDWNAFTRVCEDRTNLLAKLAEVERKRDAEKVKHDALARAVGQALLVPTLGDNEEFVEPSDHAIVGAMIGMRNERDTALARLAEAQAERDKLSLTIGRACEATEPTAWGPKFTLDRFVERVAEVWRERDEVRAKLAEAERERDAARAALATIAQEPCAACAKKENTIKALNDWLTEATNELASLVKEES